MKVNQIESSYTHYLEDNLADIERLAKTDTKETLTLFLEMITQPAADTYVNKYGVKLDTKKARFLKIINSKKMTNDKILTYVINSIGKAQRTEAKYNNL